MKLKKSLGKLSPLIQTYTLLSTTSVSPGCDICPFPHRSSPLPPPPCLSAGIIYQQNLRNLDLALTHYRRVLEMHEFTPGSVPLSLLKEVKIRECDLLERLSVMDDYVEEEGFDEMMCWKGGHEMFPDSSTIANELGNAYVEVSISL
jgi:hypothetical protein